MIEIVDANGRIVPDASIKIEAKVEGGAKLSGLGSGNPITSEDYTDHESETYKGHACAILRSTYKEGKARLTVRAEGLEPKTMDFDVS
jgi:beta-galactosidase